MARRVFAFSWRIAASQTSRTVVQLLSVRWLFVLSLTMLAPSVGFAVPGQASTAPRASFRGIAFDERLDAEPVLLPALSPAIADLPPLIARIALDLVALPSDRIPATLADLDRRLNAYVDRRVSVVLSLGAFPDGDDQVEAWRQSIRTVAEHGSGKVVAYQIGTIAAPAPAPAVDRYVFLLKVASVQLRAVDAGALILEGQVPASFDEWQGRVYAAGAAPYIDGIAVDGPPSAGDDDAFRVSVGRLTAAIERADPTSVVVLGPVGLPQGSDAAASVSSRRRCGLSARPCE